MNNSIELIKAKAESILKENILAVTPFNNRTNNYVYRITTAKNQYIFKVYKQGWPEDGKLQYVDKVLREHNIPCAGIVYYCHIDPDLPYGFLVEEFLSGVVADKVELSTEEENALYQKLAVFIRRLHTIQFSQYGYIGAGKPFEPSYSEYIHDAFDDNTAGLRENERMSREELLEVKEQLYESMKLCDELPPVLCHGDLSKKNIMLQKQGRIVLIDYDDVTAIPWVCDVARLTLWMKLNYSEERASQLRKVFLNEYSDKEKEIFNAAENILHVWECLGYMNFFLDDQRMYSKVNTIFRKAWESLRR